MTSIAAPHAATSCGTIDRLQALRNAAAVRERCERVYHWIADGHSPCFRIDPPRLADVAGFVAEVTRRAYPDLAIPPHSRWRHFCVDGIDRWDHISRGVAGSLERARAAVDLAVVSVLLDAGAGETWRYREPETDRVYARSEGLAVASLDMFKAGAFSSDPAQPLRVDATALMNLDSRLVGQGLQVTSDNPLVGLERRTELLQRLGRALASQPAVFGSSPARPGHLVDYLMAQAPDRHVSAAELLEIMLNSFSTIWPSGLTVAGFPVGDAGLHPCVRTSDESNGIVPFHKLSQWLTYSLIEPLTWAGLTVADIDQLTALAEYRNGGLLIDLGLIRPRDTIDLRNRYEVTSQVVVEWRALTIALTDRLLAPVRDTLNADASFQMPQLLQGGTWTAGRIMAQRLRPPNGPSPILVAADGSVF
jgi:hypothetical protein